MFADSGPATPLISPLPKFSGFLLICLSVEYETNDAIPAPAPGKTPIINPKIPPLIIDQKLYVISLSFINTLCFRTSLFSLEIILSEFIITSEIANRPNVTDKN